MSEPTSVAPATSDNPFFEPSSLPFALPPFDVIRDEHYGPALDRGMSEQLAEVAAIVDSPEPPTFENTVAALERSGQLLTRVTVAFFGITSAHATPPVQALEEEYSPRLTAHADAIRLDSGLLARLQAVRDGGEQLDPQARRLVERYVTEFTLAGAGLGDDDKQRLRDDNERLSSLGTEFEKRLLAEANDLAVLVEDVSELDGLTGGEISAAAEAATEQGHEGSWLVTLVLPTGHPHLAALTDRDLRRRIHQAQVARGSRGGDGDTRDLVLEIVRLRAERARLLGYPTHAHAALADSTAGSPDAVAQLLGRLAPAARRNADAERKALEAEAGGPIEAHDWAFWTEQVRAATYDVDLAAMRPYFEAERVLHDGVFLAAGRLSTG